MVPSFLISPAFMSCLRSKWRVEGLIYPTNFGLHGKLSFGIIQKLSFRVANCATLKTCVSELFDYKLSMRSLFISIP